MWRGLFRWTWRLLLLALIALAMLQFWFLVHVWYWTTHNPQTTAFMRYRLEAKREEAPHAVLQHRWVPYERIAGHLKRAVIAAEDGKFTQHSGFDWESMRAAHDKNVREGEIVSGGSTITQQLAKNLFLTPERAWWRKLQEAAITVMIEAVMGKRRILEIYLNVVEWGDGVFGAEAAARYHFGVSAASLNSAQAARLAVMLPSPRRYGPGANTPYLQRRAGVILGRMSGAAVP